MYVDYSKYMEKSVITLKSLKTLGKITELNPFTYMLMPKKIVIYHKPDNQYPNHLKLPKKLVNPTII